MDLLEQLTRTNADPALIAQLQAVLAQQAEQIAALQSLQVQNQELKCSNEALKLELAHLRRIRFGKASEAYSGEQLGLFNEALDTDLAALEAELEQSQGERKPSRAAVPDAKHCRQICRVSNTATNQRRANAAPAAAIW